MDIRTIGNTPLAVTQIRIWWRSDRRALPGMHCARQPSKSLQAAWDAGLRYFDTAPFYGFGLSERRTGDFLRSKPRETYVLSTKVGRSVAARCQKIRLPDSLLRQSAALRGRLRLQL